MYLPADAVPGFRNMGDPEEDADPDDYSELFTGSLDRGGVHINSGHLEPRVLPPRQRRDERELCRPGDAQRCPLRPG